MIEPTPGAPGPAATAAEVVGELRLQAASLAESHTQLIDAVRRTRERCLRTRAEAEKLLVTAQRARDRAVAGDPARMPPGSAPSPIPPPRT